MYVAISRRYMIFFQCCKKGTVCVGVCIYESVDVVRVNERTMYVKLVNGKQIVNIPSAYAPQVSLTAEENNDFWDRGAYGRSLLDYGPYYEHWT